MSQVKIRLTAYVEQLVSEISQLSGKSKTASIELLLEQVEAHARHNKLPETFGLNVIEAAALLNARGLGAKHLDPVHQAGGEHVPFDERLLERSNKTKTGYAGVSAHGPSFRALVPDMEAGGGTRYLPSRPTGLLAAIDRYEYFKKHNIPYGNLGWHVAELKTKHPDWTDRACLEHLRLFLEDGNTYGMKNPVTLEEVDRALERFVDRDVKPANEPELVEVDEFDPPNEKLVALFKAKPDPQPEPPASRLAAVPDVVRCAVCKDAIEDGEPFGPHGKRDYAHVACLS